MGALLWKDDFMKDIKDYETMAKLDLSGDERRWVSDHADVLVESFAKLDGIETSGVEPLITVLEIKNVLREDVVVKMVTREELLANAPAQHDGYFQVPKTLD